MLIVTWEFTGYNMTILLTSLTTVPHQVIEAAKVDGCSELSIALRIKFPLIRRTVLFIVILSIIGTLQLFNEPVMLNYIASIGNSFTPNQIIYNTAFSVRQRATGGGPVSRAGRDHDRGHGGVLTASSGAQWTPRRDEGALLMSSRQTIPRRRAPAAGGQAAAVLAGLKITVGTALLLLAAVYVVVPLYWLIDRVDQEHAASCSPPRRSCRRPTCRWAQPQVRSSPTTAATSSGGS